MRRPKVSLAPEGFRIIFVSALLVLVAAVYSLLTNDGRGLWVTAATSVWFMAVVVFFRDPERITPEGDNIIVSPADGKIISIGEAVESPLAQPGQRVSIFMSPLNVHVNRSPFSGVVKRVEHRLGRFKSAFKPVASRENEHVEVILETGAGEMAFRQIAGFLARRIVFHPKPGDSLSTGQRVGIIRFGSRVDLFIPDEVKLKVYLGDHVAAGVTIIGELKDV